MKISKVTTDEYTKTFPNLRREMVKNGIVKVILIKSDKAVTQAFEFLGGGLNLSYGSKSLFNRYKKRVGK